ncbi:MAG: hypothetical protein KC553_14550 [Nitrospina sp.]|nr:hypothetical protein [Nitrospina sp.]
MPSYKPLFQKESVRTRQYRRVIIRKTLQIIRNNPDLKDEEILALAEQEAVKVCDLCVESSMEEDSRELVDQYFLVEQEAQRKDHVGRLFLHPLDGELRKGYLKQCLIPVFCQSLVNLLGQELYERFSDRASQMIEIAHKHGIVYKDMLESPPAKALIDEILQAYRKEIQRTSGFEAQLKNQIDTALVHYQREHPGEEFNIEDCIAGAYEDFTRLMGLDK